jgi:ATP adenylyltransferase
MEYISAPWRERYVRNAAKMKECIFCRALKRADDEKACILFRGVHNFIILNKFPYTQGHLMIAPYAHLATIERAKKEAGDELVELLKLSLRVLKKRYAPHGFNAGMNLGQSAGAGVVGHYHLHVIPRWIGDANFMPLIGETRILLEDLTTTYKRLLPLFEKEKALRKER